MSSDKEASHEVEPVESVESVESITTPPSKNDRIVRCSEGHLYTTLWVPMVSFKALRFGQERYQYCPVGQHFSMTKRVDETQLSKEETASAFAHHDTRIY